MLYLAAPDQDDIPWTFSGVLHFSLFWSYVNKYISPNSSTPSTPEASSIQQKDYY